MYYFSLSYTSLLCSINSSDFLLKLGCIIALNFVLFLRSGLVFFRHALMILGTVAEVRRSGSGPAKKIRRGSTGADYISAFEVRKRTTPNPVTRPTLVSWFISSSSHEKKTYFTALLLQSENTMSQARFEYFRKDLLY